MRTSAPVHDSSHTDKAIKLSAIKLLLFLGL